MTTAVTVDTETPERDLAGSVRGAGEKARGAIEEVVAAAPSAAANGREVIDDLARRLDDAPDLNLVAAMALSVGAGLGLLVGARHGSWPSRHWSRPWRSASR